MYQRRKSTKTVPQKSICLSLAAAPEDQRLDAGTPLVRDLPEPVLTGKRARLHVDLPGEAALDLELRAQGMIRRRHDDDRAPVQLCSLRADISRLAPGGAWHRLEA